CTAKWLQTTLYLQNGYNHSCHHPSPHKIPVEEVEKNPSALHNSQFKKQQRAKMLKGERPSECDYCWKIEDLNKDYFSDRHYKTADYWAWDRFEEIASMNPEDDVYPAYLEVSFSNACNLKCSYCSPEISSKWLEEIKQHGPYPISESNQDIEWYKKVGRYPYKHSDDNPYVDAFWKWFPDALPHLRVFRITGGEPLMSKDTWRVFEYLKQNPQPNLELAINTNLAVEDKLIDKFISEINEIKSSVKNIDIYTSLESTGSQAEYSRFGLRYDLWINNLKKCLDQTPYRISIMTTINILSLPTFIDFIEMLMKLRSEYNERFENNRIPLSINYLRWPEHLSIRLLPEDMKSQYNDKILKTIEPWVNGYQQGKFARVYLEEWDQIQRLCEYLIKEQTMDSKRNNFVKYIQEYDRRRNTDFSRTFPEYAHFLEEWNA
ncbi:radical SAM protein, partial [bacterium]|nr:radical SAM protein [Candidatus Elulimicrobium humile]